MVHFRILTNKISVNFTDLIPFLSLRLWRNLFDKYDVVFLVLNRRSGTFQNVHISKELVTWKKEKGRGVSPPINRNYISAHLPMLVIWMCMY
jgi:hypothetical protein